MYSLKENAISYVQYSVYMLLIILYESSQYFTSRDINLLLKHKKG